MFPQGLHRKGVDDRRQEMRTRGIKTLTVGRARWQIYWPEMEVSRRMIFFKFVTVFAIRYEVKDLYYGVGFSIFGFGFAVDYQW